MEHNFMDGVWERVRGLEQAQALLAAEPARPRRYARRTMLVAAAAAALLLAAFTPSLIARYQEWLRVPQSAYLDQDETAVDRGIEIRTLAGFNDAATVELLFTLRDVEADRLGCDWIDMELEWEGSGSGWGSFRKYGMRFLKYDETERSWLLSAEFDLSETADFEGLSLHFTKIEPVFQTEPVEYPLEGLPVGEWIAAPGEGVPAGLGVTIYSSELADGRLKLTASMPPEGGSVDFRLVNRDGLPFTMSKWEADGVQTVEFAGVTAEEIGSGLALRLQCSYVSETIAGDWRIPVRTQPVAERIARFEGQTVGGAPLKEAALSETMARITVEQKGGIDRLGQEKLRLHLKNGAVCIAEPYSSIEHETDGGWDEMLFKWILTEPVDPETVGSIEIAGTTIRLE